MFAEDDLLPLSALQHLLFCERQCTLIHVEQLWVENLFTAQGRLMHERVDGSGHERRGNVRTSPPMRGRGFASLISPKSSLQKMKR